MPQGVGHHMGDAGRILAAQGHRVGLKLELAETTMTNKNQRAVSKRQCWGLSSKGMQGLGSF